MVSVQSVKTFIYARENELRLDVIRSSLGFVPHYLEFLVAVRLPIIFLELFLAKVSDSDLPGVSILQAVHDQIL